MADGQLQQTQSASTPLPRVAIKYCTQCRWMLRAAYVSVVLIVAAYSILKTDDAASLRKNFSPLSRLRSAKSPFCRISMAPSSSR